MIKTYFPPSLRKANTGNVLHKSKISFEPAGAKKKTLVLTHETPISPTDRMRQMMIKTGHAYSFQAQYPRWTVKLKGLVETKKPIQGATLLATATDQATGQATYFYLPRKK